MFTLPSLPPLLCPIILCTLFLSLPLLPFPPFISPLSSLAPFLNGLYPRIPPYPSPFPCQNNTFGGYSSCGYPLQFNISSPIPLLGSIGYTPSDPPLPGSQWPVDSNGNYNVRLLLPNINEYNSGDPNDVESVGNTNGCSNYNTTSTQLSFYKYPYTEYNVEITHNAILTILDPHCTSPYSVENIQLFYPSIHLIAVKANIAEGNGADELPYQLHFGPFTAPTITIPYVDAINIIKYMRQNPLEVVTFSIAGPGNATQEVRDNVIQFGKNLVFPPQRPSPFFPNLIVNTSEADPCQYSINGVWCERGIVKVIQLDSLLATGDHYDDESFTYFATHGLVHFIGAEGVGGDFPPSLCNPLYTPHVTLIAFFTSSPTLKSLPNCFDKLPIKTLFCDQCALSAFPSSLAYSQNIIFLKLNNGIMSNSLPPIFNSSSLSYLDLSNNQLYGGVPSFSGLPNLHYIDLSNNLLSYDDNPHHFDNIPTLEVISLNTNNISSSTLPYFLGSQTFLYSIDFSYNQYCGGIPSSWSTSMLSQLTTLSLSHNNITEINNDLLSSCISLTTLDISYNNIHIQGNWLLWMLHTIPYSVITFTASHNHLGGEDTNVLLSVLDYSSSTSALHSLQNVDLSYNELQNVPVDIFSSLIISWNFKGNPLVDTLPATAPSTAQIFFDLTDCPLLGNPYGVGVLPPFLTISTLVLQQTEGTNFQCGTVESKDRPGSLTFLLDPTFYGYQGCQCERGYYGKVPDCYIIPSVGGGSDNVSVTLSPFHTLNGFPIFSPSSLPFNGNGNDDISNGIQSNIPTDYITNTTTTSTLSPIYTFSDGWYGAQRYLSGMDTLWIIDYGGGAILNKSTQQYYYYDGEDISESSGSESIIGDNIIVSTTLNLYFDTSLFNSSSLFTTQMDIFQGNNPSISSLLISISSDSVTPYPSSLSILSSLSSPYSPLTPSLFTTLSSFSSIGMITLHLPYPTVCIEYRSRHSSDVVFISSFSPSSDCPDGYTKTKSSDPFPSCIPTVLYYHASIGIRVFLITLAIIISIFIFLSAIYLYSHRKLSIVKASSLKFTFIQLIAILLLSLSSILYSLIPTDNISRTIATTLCHSRVWSSCFFLMIVLTILVGKSLRISVIFGSKNLQSVKNVGDHFIWGIIAGGILIQITMLSIFSGLGMSYPDSVEYSYSASPLSAASSFDSLSSSPLLSVPPSTTTMVYQCSTHSSFSIWLAFQIFIFSILMIMGAVVGWRTRQAPSAFNESNHIANSLYAMTIILIILVPLDWTLLNKQPEAAIVIQGGGQLLVSFILWGSSVGMKIMYIWIHRHDVYDKNAQQATSSSGRRRNNIKNANNPNGHNDNFNNENMMIVVNSHKKEGNSGGNGHGNGNVSGSGTDDESRRRPSNQSIPTPSRTVGRRQTRPSSPVDGMTVTTPPSSSQFPLSDNETHHHQSTQSNTMANTISFPTPNRNSLCVPISPTGISVTIEDDDDENGNQNQISILPEAENYSGNTYALTNTLPLQHHSSLSMTSQLPSPSPDTNILSAHGNMNMINMDTSISPSE